MSSPNRFEKVFDWRRFQHLRNGRGVTTDVDKGRVGIRDGTTSDLASLKMSRSQEQRYTEQAVVAGVLIVSAQRPGIT